MQPKRRYLIVAGSALAIAAGGVGVAAATGGIGGSGDDDSVSGPAADRASAAALEITHGGTANSVERDTENGATWEVEVTKPDGSTVDVRLDENYGRVVVEGDSGDTSEQADGSDGSEHEPAGQPDQGGEDGD
jgi:hypothetical protein